jgi:hypothetical protein
MSRPVRETAGKNRASSPSSDGEAPPTPCSPTMFTEEQVEANKKVSQVALHAFAIELSSWFGLHISVTTGGCGLAPDVVTIWGGVSPFDRS